MDLIQESPYYASPEEVSDRKASKSLPTLRGLRNRHSKVMMTQLTEMWYRMAADNQHGIVLPEMQRLNSWNQGRTTRRWLVTHKPGNHNGYPTTMVATGNFGSQVLWEALLEIIQPSTDELYDIEGVYATIPTAANYPAYMLEAMDEGCRVLSRLNLVIMCSEKHLWNRGFFDNRSVDYAATMLPLFWDQLTERQRPLFFAFCVLHDPSTTMDQVEHGMDVLEAMAADHRYLNWDPYAVGVSTHHSVSSILSAYQRFQEYQSQSQDLPFDTATVKAFAMSNRFSTGDLPLLARRGFTQQFLDYYGAGRIMDVYGVGFTPKLMRAVEGFLGEDFNPQVFCHESPLDESLLPKLQEWRDVASSPEAAGRLMGSWLIDWYDGVRDVGLSIDALGEPHASWVRTGQHRDQAEKMIRIGVKPEDAHGMNAIPGDWLEAW